jgi:hypothetical protein
MALLVPPIYSTSPATLLVAVVFTGKISALAAKHLSM